MKPWGHAASNLLPFGLQTQSILSQLPVEGKCLWAPASEEAARKAPSGALPAAYWCYLCGALQ